MRMEPESASVSKPAAWLPGEPLSPSGSSFPGPSPSADTPTAFRLARGQDGLRAIRADWLRLTDSLSFKRFFHLYDWYWSYLDALEQASDRVCFFMAYRRGVPVGVLPFKQGTRYFRGIPVRALEVVMHPHLCLSDVVFPPAFAGGRVWHEFRGFLQDANISWDAMLWWKVLPDAHIWHLLKDQPYLSLPQGRCDYFLRDAGYERLTQGFSKNFRANLRKARKRMQQSGKVEYQVARGRSQLLQAFPQFLAVEASGWKGEDGANTAIKLDRGLTRFYQNLIEHFGPRKECEISLLKLDGRCIAARFCLIVDHTCYSLKIAYDEAYARLAPGKLLFREDLKRILGEGRNLNLISDASWHANWRPQSHPVSNIYVFNQTPLGTAVSTLFKVRRFFKARTSA